MSDIAKHVHSIILDEYEKYKHQKEEVKSSIFNDFVNATSTDNISNTCNSGNTLNTLLKYNEDKKYNCDLLKVFSNSLEDTNKKIEHDLFYHSNNKDGCSITLKCKR